MKKIILTMLLAMATLTASASEIRYFTNSQARRVATALDAQNELMIYCGYEYELATYVIVNEVWAEAVNSKYYEIWLYGYDAYTGEEIYMPIDLSCIWLYNRMGNRMYNASQYLRFRGSFATPNFYWTMPPYNPFVRHYHDPHFNHCYTYHFHIHRHGWHPGMIPPGGPAHYHPYYTRTPKTPAPVPHKPFTPGMNYPSVDGHEYIGSGSGTTTGTRGTAISNRNGGTRNGNNSNNSGNTGTTSRTSTTTTGTTNRGAATSGRGTNTSGTSDRGSNTSGTSDRGSNTSGTTNRGSNTSGTTNRGSNTSGTTNRGSNTSGTTNRGSNTSGSTDRGSNTRGTTSRSSNTNATSGRNSEERNNNRGTVSSNLRGTSTTSGRNTSGTSNRGSR